MEQPFTYVYDASAPAMCPNCGLHMMIIRQPPDEVTEPAWKYRRWICGSCKLSFHVPLVKMPAVQVPYPIEVAT